ncbi:MAG: hypothetical protein EON58_17390 [Alphaproteobacteria bacterium]|nr:MAG: hypothetical protein EON58_17390 [Alphaproteobacteria bacterium]
MKWHDTRVLAPNPNHYDQYTVVFVASGIEMLGRAEWMPRDGYTSGDWKQAFTTNGNPINGEVLYWAEHPKRPSIGACP